MTKLSHYLQLMRISLLPTAWSNVLMGFVLVQGIPEEVTWRDLLIWELGLLLVISSCLYISGMVLNDFFDYQQDAIERPGRPIPSGKISRRNAGLLGFGLMAFAIVVAVIFSMGQGRSGLTIVGATGFVTLALATAIIFYNAWAKHTIIGPLAMGLCRALNVLLGGSMVSVLTFKWPILIGIAVYVAGITQFAKQEHTTSQRVNLVLGFSLMLIGIGLIAWYPFSDWFLYDFFNELSAANGKRHKVLFIGLLTLMIFPIIRKAIVAIGSRQPGDVKRTVIGSLLTIIVIDASICYLVAPSIPAYACFVAALLFPAFLMTRRIMAT